MKRLIIRTLLFLLPVLAVVMLWEILMYNFPHAFKYKRDVIMTECRKNSEIVFLGSSHAFYGVNTDILPRASNLAYVSQELNQDRFILEQLLSQPNRIKYAVIPISIFSLFESRNNLEAWRNRDYVRYWGYPAAKFTDHFFILDNVAHQLKYVRKTKKRIKRKGQPGAFSFTASGWGTDYREAGNIAHFAQMGKSAAERHGNVDLENIRHFHDLQAMIKLAAQQQIKVILYTPPGHQSYCRNINSKQEKQMRELIARAAAEPNVFFIDLLRSREFTDEDFFDPDHMNHRGAEKLARILYTFCQESSR